jgi:hypothetical protein
LIVFGKNQLAVFPGNSLSRVLFLGLFEKGFAPTFSVLSFGIGSFSGTHRVPFCRVSKHGDEG